jgi:putative cell wall-binding protein
MRRVLVVLAVATVVTAVAGPSAACAGTRLVSVDAEGRAADEDSSEASLSADGTVVAFSSDASDIVAGDQRFSGPTCDDVNARRGTDVFVRNLSTGGTVLVSTTADGVPANGDSGDASLSDDGTVVAFASAASDLVADDRNGERDVFVRDLRSGVTSLVSAADSGGSGRGPSFSPRLSGDGAAVAFTSFATDLTGGIPAPDEMRTEVFHRDLGTGTTTWVSAPEDGVTDGGGEAAAIDADGSVVVFSSNVAILRRDIETHRTTMAARASVAFDVRLDLDAAGDTVALSTEDALDPADGNEREDVYVLDVSGGSLERISVDTVGGNANSSSGAPVMSADGRRVVFESTATDIVNGDRGADDEGESSDDLFLRDRDRSRTVQVNVTAQRADPAVGASGAAISADGHVVAFDSSAGDLVVNDGFPGRDVFSRHVESDLTAQRPAQVEEPAAILRLAPSERAAVDVALAWSGERDLGEPDFGARTVLLARDDDPADALASGGLQGGLHVSPLLLTPSNRLDDEVARELARLNAERVLVLGGPQAIAEPVLEGLRGRGYEVDRRFGATRVETAIELDVYPSARPREGDEHALLVRAFGVPGDATSAFADSIAAGRYAAAAQLPVLLTASDGLPPALEEHLRQRIAVSLDRVTVLGGPDAVSEEVVAQLRSLGLEVERLAGADRADTAVQVATRLFGTAHVDDAAGAALVNAYDPIGWASGFAAAAPGVPGSGPLLVVGDEVPASTRAWFEGGDGDTSLVCGPLVTDRICDEVARLGGQLPSG